VKPAPDPNVTRWLDEVDEDQVFLSVAPRLDQQSTQSRRVRALIRYSARAIDGIIDGVGECPS
jgi:hypothetical protein